MTDDLKPRASDGRTFEELAGNEVRGRFEVVDGERQRVEDMESFTLLLEDPLAWRDALIALVRDCDVRFSLRRADADQKRIECNSRGAEGRREWARYNADWSKWRANTSGFQRRCLARLQDVKTLIRDTRDPGSLKQRIYVIVSEFEQHKIDADTAIDRVATAVGY